MTAHACSITCTKPACVKRRIAEWVNDLAGDYVESWVGEMVAEEWYKDKSRILELMAENKKLQAHIDFLERQPRDPFLPENSVVTSK